MLYWQNKLTITPRTALIHPLPDPQQLYLLPRKIVHIIPPLILIGLAHPSPTAKLPIVIIVDIGRNIQIHRMQGHQFAGFARHEIRFDVVGAQFESEAVGC